MLWLKDILEEKPIACGIWLSMGSHIVAEIAGLAGFDWVLLDLEHGLGGEGETLHCLQVLARANTAVVVRVPSVHSDLIKRALDFGASAIMVPMVETRDDAEGFVSLLKYPPQGIRGLTASSRASDFGHSFQDYFADANTKVGGIVQVETPQAVTQAAALAALDGVDALFVGHSDLSLALGCYGDLRAPELQRAEDLVLEACSLHGKHAGMLLKPGSDISSYVAKGFTLIAMGTDIGCLKSAFSSLVQGYRQIR